MEIQHQDSNLIKFYNDAYFCNPLIVSQINTKRLIDRHDITLNLLNLDALETCVFYAITGAPRHMVYHFLNGGLGIRPFLDLWLIRHKTNYDEDTVEKMCRDCGILKFYKECCYLSEVWLAGKKHTTTSISLQHYCIEGGVFGTSKNALLSKKRKHKGFSYIIHRLFISSNALKETYPFLKRHPILLPFYQIRRWPDALITKRKRIKKEIREFSSIETNEIDSFDRLMKRVGF